MYSKFYFASIAVLFVIGASVIDTADAQSPFSKKFGAIKFLDAYFGQPNERLEVRPGDSNVPLTVIIANVGSEDITGIRAQLSMPLALGGTDGSRSARADSASNALAGDSFYLTFFVNVSPHATIRDHKAIVSVDFSRLRESGVRNEVFDFDFSITGDTLINVSARKSFIMSLRDNTIVIDITNSGTAPVSSVNVSVQDTELAMQQSMTNIENVVVTKSSWDLGNIGAGSSKEIITSAYVPGTLRDEVLRIPLLVSYLNAHGDRQSVTRFADFYVQGFIDARIYNVKVIMLSGSPTLIGEIINEGNENALFGFVTLVPQGDSNITETVQFIDEIEIDSPVPFSIPLVFDGGVRYGEHEVKVDVRYKDSTRKETVISHTSMINIPQPEIIAENPDFLVILLLIPIIGLVIFWRKRSRRAQTV